jgi:hypothetical protein
MVGNLCADTLCTLKATPSGGKRISDTVRYYSMCWGWSANVTETVVMVFGDAGVRAHCTFRRDSAKLLRVSQTLYLDLVPAEDGTCDGHTKHVRLKTWVAFHYCASVLASSRIPVDTKLRHVLNWRMHPVLEYGMQVWAPSDHALLKPEYA